jgi:thioredoxin-related protein
MKHLMVIFVALFFCSTSLWAAKMSNTIVWQTYTPAAFIQAKKEKKLVLIFGKAEWCPWCRATRNKVLTDPMVIQVINKYYVPVILDVDKEAILANQYDIRQLPTFVVSDANYKVLRTFAGYREPQDVAAMLEGAALRD